MMKPQESSSAQLSKLKCDSPEALALRAATGTLPRSDRGPILDDGATLLGLRLGRLAALLLGGLGRRAALLCGTGHLETCSLVACVLTVQAVDLSCDITAVLTRIAAKLRPADAGR
jgi:hypothetical protein